jgi:hypothetical protein
VKLNIGNTLHNISLFVICTFAGVIGFMAEEFEIRFMCSLVLLWMAIVGIKWDSGKSPCDNCQIMSNFDRSVDHFNQLNAEFNKLSRAFNGIVSKLKEVGYDPSKEPSQ